MQNRSPANPPQAEAVGFQVSLLRLVYASTDSSPQVSQLEGSLKRLPNSVPRISPKAQRNNPGFAASR
jgi:hypothetical protein